MRKRFLRYAPARADIYCQLEQQPDGSWQVTYTEPSTHLLGTVETQEEAEALAKRWACASATTGASTAADLAAEQAAWEDSLALIEIHPGARCELLLAEPGAERRKRWLTVERPTRARAVDTAYGRWLCTVQGQRCLVQRIEATLLEEAAQEERTR
jgi:hypothetical protein